MTAESKLARLVKSAGFQHFITIVIILNAITLGLETSEKAVAHLDPLLAVLDRIALTIFVIELSMKISVYHWRFFKEGWNIFDFLIVAVSLIPAAGTFSILRALRILRVLRMFSVIPRLRAVIQALLEAIPGMASILMVLILVYYVAAVLATQLFGAAFPVWFGSLGKSMFSLFQIMTLESWSMGIVRPVMQVFPWSWVFFVPFIVLTSFTVLNLFIAILVSTIQSQHESERREEMAVIQGIAHEESELLLQQIQNLHQELSEVREILIGKRRDDSNKSY